MLDQHTRRRREGLDGDVDGRLAEHLAGLAALLDDEVGAAAANVNEADAEGAREGNGGEDISLARVVRGPSLVEVRLDDLALLAGVVDT